jgi:hypothetical protein
VSLKDARNRRDEARKLLAADVDPGEIRKAKKTARTEQAANSFEVVAREWFAKYSTGWAKSHADKIIRRLERDIFPWLGSRPVAEITAPELLQSLRRIEERDVLETAHRALHTTATLVTAVTAVTASALVTFGATRSSQVEYFNVLATFAGTSYPCSATPIWLNQQTPKKWLYMSIT